MDEAQRLTCTDPTAMLEALRGKASDRRLRLFACAYCRLIWHLLSDERSREAVRIAEKFADRRCSESERQETERRAWASYCDMNADQFSAAQLTAADAVHIAAGDTPDFIAVLIPEFASESSTISELIRDVFGNPFRPPPLDTSLLNDAVIKLATTIYEERAWQTLPILADALEECGVAGEALNHCRQPGVW